MTAHVARWREALKRGSGDSPKPALPRRAASHHSCRPVLTSETKRRLDACRNLLVGKLPLPTDQVELITLALIYKFMDDLDEESVAMGGKRSFFTGPLAPYRWRALLPQTVSGDERVALFSEGVEAIGNAKTGAHLPELFRDIFRNAFLKFRDGRILTLFLNEVNGFAYSHSEELGNAFEYLLQCMGTQGENGQFRTPRHIIDWIVACLDPQPTDRILDPACGTGGFLVSAYRHILQKHTSPGSKLPGDRLGHEQRLYANFTGYDITDLMVKLSKVNLFLHQFPSPAIHIYDSLSNDARWSEKADLILANPPFMTPKGGVTPHTKFRVPAKKAEVLFTDYIAEHLTPDGRAGIIVPNGIVATTQNAYVSLRRFLVEDSLVAVVSLPAGVFKPYSGVKTSILLLDKKLARRTDKILFLKIAADGFDLGDQRREIAANDLPEAERVMKAWFNGKLSSDFASPLAWKLVEKRELLAQHGCNLDVSEIGVGKASENGEMPFFKISDLLQGVRMSNKVQKNQFLSAGRYPIVAQSENFIAGYWNDDADVFRVKTPLVLFGDHTRRFKYVDFDFVLGADGVKVLQFDERVLPRYAYFALNTLKLRNLGYSRHYKELLSHEIPLPPLEEQRRIVAEIEGYQQVIDGARQILAAYGPRIAVDPEWETVTIGSVARVVSGHAFSLDQQGKTDEEIPFYKVSDMNLPGNESFMISHNNAVSRKTLSLLKAKAHPAGTIIFPKVGAAIATNKKRILTREATFDNNVMGIVPSEKLMSRFLHTWLAGFDLSKWASESHPPSMRQGTVEDQEIPLPPLPEQRRIVAELDAEAAEVAAVRALIPRYEAKIQRVLARVWGTAT